MHRRGALLEHIAGRRTTSASTPEFCNTGVSFRSWKARRLREYARMSGVLKYGNWVKQRFCKPGCTRPDETSIHRVKTKRISVHGSVSCREGPNVTGHDRCQNVKVKQQRAQNVVWAPNRKEVKGRPIIPLTTRGTVTHPLSALSALSRHLPMGIPWLRSSPTEIKVLARNQGSAYCGTLSSGGGQAQHSKIKIP